MTLKEFLELITGPYGVLGVMLGVIYLVYKLGRISKSYDGMLKDVSELKDNMSIVKNDIIYIKGVLSKDYNQFANSKSPISLTKEGKDISNELKVKESLDGEVWNKIKDKIKEGIAKSKEQTPNPYTIQEICFNIGSSVDQYLTSADMDRIKKIAYQKGINLASFDIIFGIEIRDRYFKENEKILDDIDKYRPKENPS